MALLDQPSIEEQIRALKPGQSIPPELLAQIMRRMDGPSRLIDTSHTGPQGFKQWTAPEGDATFDFTVDQRPGFAREETEAEQAILDWSNPETVIYGPQTGSSWGTQRNSVWDSKGNYLGESSGDGNSLAAAKFIASSVAAGYGTEYLNGLEAGATASSGMGNGAFLGENVASGVGAWDAAATSAGLDLTGGAVAGDLVGGDLVDMTADGVQFGGGGEEAVGNGLKTNASNFGPNYSNAATGGAGGGGGGGLFENLLNSITGGDILKVGLGVAGTVVNNNTARDLADQNRIDQKDLLDTKNDQEITVLEKKDEISDKNKVDDRAYDQKLREEKWARMTPVSFNPLELKATPGAQRPEPTLTATQSSPNSTPSDFDGGGLDIYASVAPPGMRWDASARRYVPVEGARPAGGGLLNQDRRRFG